MFSLVSRKFLAMRNIVLYSVHTLVRIITTFRMWTFCTSTGFNCSCSASTKKLLISFAAVDSIGRCKRVILCTCFLWKWKLDKFFGVQFRGCTIYVLCIWLDKWFQPKLSKCCCFLGNISFKQLLAISLKRFWIPAYKYVPLFGVVLKCHLEILDICLLSNLKCIYLRVDNYDFLKKHDRQSLQISVVI